MKKHNLLVLAMACGLLAACDTGPDSDAPDIIIEIPSSSTSSSTSSGASGTTSSSSSSSSGSVEIVNTDLPISEDFEATTTGEFFSGAYKSLATSVPEDTDGAFYYPTAGFYNTDGTLDLNPDFWITDDADKALRIGSRFSIGQTWSALAGDGVENPKTGTTPGTEIGVSWGELDLSRDYKVSFCIVEAVGTRNFQVYVDNNTTGSANSIHLGDSRLLSVGVSSLVAGQRVEINVPGTATVEPGGTPVDIYSDVIGTANSFLQLRVESGSYVVIDDFKVEYQDAVDDSGLPDCSTKSTIWGEVNPAMPADPTTAPTLEAGDGQLTVTWDGLQYATSYNIAYNTTDSTTGATVVSDITETTTLLSGLTNDTPLFVFVQGVNSNGVSEFSPSATATPVGAAVAPSVPTDVSLTTAPGEITVVWTGVAGASTYTLAYNTADSTTGATEVADLTDTNYTITGLTNDVIYYVFVKAVNSAGESAYTDTQNATPTEAIAVTELPLTVTLSVDKDTFFGTNSVTPAQTLTQAPLTPLNFIEGGGSGIELDAVAGTIKLANGGRFTIGQIIPDGGATVDTADTDTEVFGDLNLSGDYKIIIDVVSAADTGVFQVYIDNNTSSSAKSIHGSASRPYSANAADIADGSTIEIVMAGVDHIGTAASFIHVRTDSAIGADGVVISGIRIEPIVPNTPLPLTANLNVEKDVFFGSGGATPGQTLTIEPTYPMFFVEGGGSGIELDSAAGTIKLSNGGRFTIGQVVAADGATDDTADTDTATNGDLDLSGDYKISIDVVSAPDTGVFQVYVDNNTTSSSKSMHGSASRPYSSNAVDIVDSSTIEILMTGTDHVGTSTSFIQLRTDSSIGADGVVISGIRIEAVTE